jgi:hypothetical protein
MALHRGRSLSLYLLVEQHLPNLLSVIKQPLTRDVFFFIPIMICRVLNLHHPSPPLSRTPSMQSVDASYIPPVPPLIQDYRPYYHTPTDLSGKDTHALTDRVIT